MHLKARGRFFVTKDTIRIVFDADFCRYYYHLLNEAHYKTLKFQTPRHGGHITIINPKIHKGIDCGKYRRLHGQRVEFKYDIGGNFGGFRSGKFKNFWMDVDCKDAEWILDELNIPKQKGFSRLHVTICNNKNL